MARNKIIPYRPDLKSRARKLRNSSTYGEELLWAEIRRRQLGYQFHRQVRVLDYIVDFYCHELRLAIEVDGDSHNSPEVIRRDKQRQSRIEKRRVHFIRLTDDDVRGDIRKPVEQIKLWIEENKDKIDSPE
jgi:very-short-patch-repair endonuclease